MPAGKHEIIAIVVPYGIDINKWWDSVPDGLLICGDTVKNEDLLDIDEMSQVGRCIGLALSRGMKDRFAKLGAEAQTKNDVVTEQTLREKRSEEAITRTTTRMLVG